MTNTIYVNAENQVLGRLASHVAKLLLKGNKVIVFNAEKSILAGSKKRIVQKFREKYEIKTLKNPKKVGPKHPRTPDGILRRSIRGMLPYKKPKGKKAFKKLIVYCGENFIPKNANIIKFKDADLSKLGNGYVYLGEIAKIFGWKG